jgi:hypothetical protein
VIDFTAAMMGPGAAHDAATLNFALSIEEDGVFGSKWRDPLENALGDIPTPSAADNPRHAKIVISLVAGIFAATAGLICYLIMS